MLFEVAKDMIEVKIAQFLDSDDWRLFQSAFGRIIVFVPQHKPIAYTVAYTIVGHFPSRVKKYWSEGTTFWTTVVRNHVVRLVASRDQ